MSDHTKEPWSVAGIADEMIVAKVSELAHAHIATIHHNGNDSRRIVACVNACRGLPTDELEQKGLVAAVGTQLLEADQLRDELLAALEEVHRIASNSNMTHNMMVIRDHCADAIAKAKGGAA